jgi:hypothetical protein
MINLTVERDFREYALPDDIAVLSVDTSGATGLDRAVLRITANDDSFDVKASVDRDTARLIGSHMLIAIGFSVGYGDQGAPMQARTYATWPNWDVETASHVPAGVLSVADYDNSIAVQIDDVDYEMNHDIAADIAERLIAFGGPDMDRDLYEQYR